MSNIIDFPERTIKVDWPKIRPFLDEADNDPEKLFNLAISGLLAAETLRKKGSGITHDRQIQQNVVNAIALTCCACMTLLGVPRGDETGGIA